MDELVQLTKILLTSMGDFTKNCRLISNEKLITTPFAHFALPTFSPKSQVNYFIDSINQQALRQASNETLFSDRADINSSF